MTCVAILNSRQSKTPAGNDPWVKGTLAAVDHAARNGWTIASSIGLNTWELVTWAAGQKRMPLRLFCPGDFTDDEKTAIFQRFGLIAELVEWSPVIRRLGQSASKDWWLKRDATIIAAADVLLPVSVRNGGRMKELLQARQSAVDEKFRISYSAIAHHAHSTITAANLNPELLSWPTGWLIHWTRACHGPWPGEREAEFYSDLIQSEDEYCHSARRTLGRILCESRIRASAWRIGAGAPMVAFTELSPSDSLKLMRWRPRWSRWSFEPYGIAIRTETAMQLGAQPVRYVDEREWSLLTDAEKSFAHHRGKNADVWPSEREWRLSGDLDLAAIPSAQIRILVRRPSECSGLQQYCSHRILSLESA